MTKSCRPAVARAEVGGRMGRGDEEGGGEEGEGIRRAGREKDRVMTGREYGSRRERGKSEYIWKHDETWNAGFCENSAESELAAKMAKRASSVSGRQKNSQMSSSADSPSVTRKGHSKAGQAATSKDDAIRAGKREKWSWQKHEVIELKSRVKSLDTQPLFLWAWDDVCVAHTKRRVLSIENAETDDPQKIKVSTVVENSEDIFHGIKQCIRKILQGSPSGMKLQSLQV
eukprot:757066-Hanusia_phi.AAC.2